MPSQSPEHSLDALGVLAEPLRRSLYQYVVQERRDVSRNDAAAAVGIQRNLAAFHLDKLVDAGLLEATFRRLTDRTGPGAGRPAKVYRRAVADHSVSLPPRAYPVAAELLAEVVEEVGAETALHAAALRAGRTVGVRAWQTLHPCDREPACAEQSSAQADLAQAPEPPRRQDFAHQVEEVLEECGFEPFRQDDKIRMHNCPFHQLSRQFPPLICGMNLALVAGIVEGLGGEAGLAHLDPAPDRCCVAVHATSSLSDVPDSNTYAD